MTPNGFNTLMDTNEIRRIKIKALIEERFGGVDGKFADAVKKPRPNISGMLKGTRPIGEKVAHAIEDALELGRGWLDREENGAGIPAAPFPPEQKILLDAWTQGGPAKQAALAALAALPEQEMGMLLMVMQSAAAKYQQADPHAHLRANERRASEKLVRNNLPEPPTEAADSPIFTERRKAI